MTGFEPRTPGTALPTEPQPLPKICFTPHDVTKSVPKLNSEHLCKISKMYVRPCVDFARK